MMGRWAIVVLVLIAACGDAVTPTIATAVTTSTTAATTSTTSSIDVGAWRADLDAFVAGLERIHPNPYWRVGEDVFKADVAAVSARLPELTEDQATLEIVRLAALIDGHTSVFVGFLGWDLAHIQFYAFDEGIGVVGSDDPALVGGRLIAIGDTPADEAVERVAVLVSYDNPMTKNFWTPFLLTVPRVLAGLGITDDPDLATFTIETRDGSTVEVTPETGDFEQFRAWFGDPVIGMPVSDRAEYLARRTSPFWWHTLDDGTVYLQYNEVTGAAEDPATGHVVALIDIVNDVAAALDATPGSRLVLDVRHNGGGDNHTYGRLLTMLGDHFADECGLFVITGRATFSAAVNFVTEVEQQTTAVLVGEPTGGAPNNYGDIVNVNLPNSRIAVRVSRLYWEFGGPDDHRIWIEPQIAVPPTLADWNAGRDAALEAALAAPLCGS